MANVTTKQGVLFKGLSKKVVIGTFIAILLLGYGVVRIGVGASLLAQTLEVVNFPDLADGVAEVKLFIEARANDQIFPFSLKKLQGSCCIRSI
jgi:hypothetical protein